MTEDLAVANLPTNLPAELSIVAIEAVGIALLIGYLFCLLFEKSDKRVPKN